VLATGPSECIHEAADSAMKAADCRCNLPHGIVAASVFCGGPGVRQQRALSGAVMKVGNQGGRRCDGCHAEFDIFSVGCAE
jgi:hypothetical protein